MTDSSFSPAAAPSGSPVAVIDLGSGSSRLLISYPAANQASPDEEPGVADIRLHVVTRMGEGSAGVLSSEGLARVEEALLTFQQRCADARVQHIVVVATEAARRATNVHELQGLVQRVLGTDVHVLSSADEGRLAFAGATSGLASGSLALVLDIGGASTEFAVGHTDAPGNTRAASLSPNQVSVVSLPIGAVQISDQYIESDPPDPAELSSALSVVTSHVDDVIRDLPAVLDAISQGVVVGVGGTNTTTAAVELGLAEYRADVINGFVLERDAAEDVFRTLATESNADRAFNPGLHAERVSLIVGGLCVLLAVMRRLVINEIIMSEADLLDGIVAELRAS